MFMAKVLSESRPLDVRQVRTRAALRGAMLELTGERPYAGISIGEIAQRAGIGYATFFRHYRDKDALLADVAEEFIVETMLRMAPLTVAIESRAAALTLCRYVEERRAIFTTMLAGGARDAVREEILARSIRQVDRSGTAKASWLPESLGATHMVTAVLTIISWWLEHGRDRSAEDVSVIIDRLVLTPALVLTAPPPATISQPDEKVLT